MILSFLMGLPLKKIGYFAIIMGLMYGANKLYGYHIDTVASAVVAAENSVLIQQEKFQDEKEEELSRLAEVDKKKLQDQIKLERKKIDRLNRQLLIDHDLDRLLQRKPGLILGVVNRGTAQYLEELKDATQ